MTGIVQTQGLVTGGVDTHRDFHVAAAVDPVGKVLGCNQFPTTSAGYRQLLEWLATFGPLGQLGVEGTGSWGAGLARYLTDAEVEVIEVSRPNRQRRRRHGKSDTTDAISAAKAVLSGDATGFPRAGTGPVESMRQLQVVRRSAKKQRDAVANQIHSLVVTSPEPIRAALRDLTMTKKVAIALNYRPGDPLDPHQATKISLRALATRWNALTEEIDQLTNHIEAVVTATAPPALLDEVGIGSLTAADLLIAAGSNPDRMKTEAAYAALCGASPVDASSGLQQRHRLNRGGDRQANAALYRIVIVRLRYHQPTRDYMQRRLAQGKTKKEIIRNLKRNLARHIWRLLTHPHPTQQAA